MTVRVQDMKSAQGMVHKAFPQCLGSTILGDSPQSKLIYIASPYAGDITGNTQFAIRCCLCAIQ
mgnify:FL=1